MVVSTVFIESSGYGTISMLAFLEDKKEKLSSTKNWTVFGTASIILALKLAGYSYPQIFEEVKKLPFLGDMIPYSNLFPCDDDEATNAQKVKDWLVELIEGKHLFDAESKISDVTRLTGIVPKFVFASGGDLGVSEPRDCFIDSVMKGLTCPGFFSGYMDCHSSSGVDSYPAGDKGLHLYTYGKVISRSDDPIFRLRNNLIRDYYRRLKHSAKKIENSIEISYTIRRATESYKNGLFHGEDDSEQD